MELKKRQENKVKIIKNCALSLDIGLGAVYILRQTKSLKMTS